MASRKHSELPNKLTLAAGDEFLILDSETAVLEEKNASVTQTVAFSGLQPASPAGTQLGSDGGWTPAGDSATLNVGSSAGTVAAGDAPGAAVASHESTYNHLRLPTADQKAALDGAATASGANPFATVNELPAASTDELVAVSATDTTPGYLAAKVTSTGASITITTNGAGGNETLNLEATESDPVFSASAASSITGTDITNWNDAFSWGDHSGLYLAANHPASAVINSGLGDQYLADDGTYKTVAGGGADEKVGVSATDTTPDYLQEKLTSGDASVSITRINAGADEQLDIRATGAGGGEANAGENLGAGAQVYAGMNGVNLTFRSLADTATVTWTQGVDTLTAQVPANTFDAFGDAADVQSNLDLHTGDGSIHFTVGSISHTAITDVGTNTHTQIDNHIADGSVHYAQNAISITSNQISNFDSSVENSPSVSANTSHRLDGTIHFTQAAISIPASQISDFDTEVANNTAVTANTAKVSADGSIATHSDVDISGITTNQILKWNGSAFVASDDETGAGGGGGLTPTVGPAANTTLAVGNDYLVDMSAWTQDYTYTLPASFAFGAQINISVIAGHATHRLIVKGANGTTINTTPDGGIYTILSIAGHSTNFVGGTANTAWRGQRLPNETLGALYKINKQTISVGSFNVLDLTVLENRFGFSLIEANTKILCPDGVRIVNSLCNVEVQPQSGTITEVRTMHDVRTNGVDPAAGGQAQFQIPGNESVGTLHNLYNTHINVIPGSGTMYTQILINGTNLGGGLINDFLDDARRNYIKVIVVCD